MFRSGDCSRADYHDYRCNCYLHTADCSNPSARCKNRPIYPGPVVLHSNSGSRSPVTYVAPETCESLTLAVACSEHHQLLYRDCMFDPDIDNTIVENRRYIAECALA